MIRVIRGLKYLVLHAGRAALAASASEVTLPEEVDDSSTSASLDDGVLTIRAPKAASDPPAT
jgi:HSP20 family molecular chaperone IbpA